MARGETYEQFVEKFKPKKTTDDCYTPSHIWPIVDGYVRKTFPYYANADFLRPFYPGGDYEHAEYPKGAVVVDNPPFSILSKIVRFYLSEAIPFFLFAPSLTAIGYLSHGASVVFADTNITFENGALINIGFVHNLGGPAIRTAPQLFRNIEEAEKAALKHLKKQVRSIDVPDFIMTGARFNKLASAGVEVGLGRDAFLHIRKTSGGYNLFGSGVIIGEKVAERIRAERILAERILAERIQGKSKISIGDTSEEMRIARSLDSVPVHIETVEVAQ